MPAPILSKVGVPTVTLSVASTFPGREPITMNQFTGISDDNTVRVASLGPPRRTLEVKFEQLTDLDIASLEVFFASSVVNWGLNEFSYTDENSTVWTVRYLSPSFSPERVSDGNYSLNMVFTVVA